MKIRPILLLSTTFVLACSSIMLTGLSTTSSTTSSTTDTAVTTLQPTIQATPVLAWITADKAVHVRDQASRHGLHVTYLYHGNPVKVYECKEAPDFGLWARTDRGWVNSRYLSKNACK